MMCVGVLDYGAGNLGSVLRALQALSFSPKVIERPEDFLGVDKVIFPGVGAAAQAMNSLQSKHLAEPLLAHAANGKPLLGICVGMQVLGVHSEEGNTSCLGILPFTLKKFSSVAPVPHMGWNELEWNSENSEALAMANGLEKNSSVYFVHSFFVPIQPTKHAEFIAASTEYSGQTFVSAIAYKNIWGTQFHVEKSGKIGLKILKNFLDHG